MTVQEEGCDGLTHSSMHGQSVDQNGGSQIRTDANITLRGGIVC